MTRLWLMLSVAVLLAGVGCAGNSCNTCNSCGHQGGLAGQGLRNPNRIPRIPHSEYPEGIQPHGPPTAGVAYPYYTTRGPRDFLVDQPPTIGY